MQQLLPDESIVARDKVLYSDVGEGAVLNTTYGHYSPIFPNPITGFSEIIQTTLGHLYESLPWNGVRQWLEETWEYHYVDTYISAMDVFNILMVALLFTVIRYIVTEAFLKKIPIWFKCVESEGEKFPEAAFRTFAYSVSFMWTSKVISNHDYFYHPFNTVIDFAPGVSIPSSMYWLYMYEIGFYIHSIYATLFVEVIRRDFVVQLIHHVVTVLLLGYSMSVRLYGFGILVLFMHDLGDALLEGAKAILYFKVRDGKTYQLPETLANIIFAIFTLSWILFRLYWYPLKALYASAHISKNYLHTAPHYLLPNILLWILYILHWYWFYFIAQLVIRVITGNEISDTRDYEDENVSDDKDSKKKNDN